MAEVATKHEQILEYINQLEIGEKKFLFGALPRNCRSVRAPLTEQLKKRKIAGLSVRLNE